jgi:ABC-type antimicrobial peptide transport system permease subunit
MLNFWGNETFVQRSAVFAVRTDRAGSESLMNQVREAVWSLNRDLPLARVRTMEETYRASMARSSFALVMLAIAGGMALLLGLVGIYGVISYSVSQRTRELGIRMALGTPPRALKSMVVRQGVVLASIGVAFGLAGAAALTRLMSSLLFNISPVDPVTYAAVRLDWSVRPPQPATCRRNVPRQWTRSRHCGRSRIFAAACPGQALPSIAKDHRVHRA